MSIWEDDGSAEQARLVKLSRAVTELHQIKASAVPSVPKQLTAQQRLAALNLASSIAEYRELPGSKPAYAMLLLETAEKMLREVAS